ncbi:MAG: tRNA (cmo5U34)-methyltransferase [Gammaproteobacteria bacterium]|jgi:tRNA (cmo5U34)-methyltransferase
MSTSDRIYAQQLSKVSEFVFDDKVANVFQDMVSRSVPGYATTISTIAELAAQLLTDGDKAYDLGCSLGAATFAMRHAVSDRNCKIIAVDTSEAMVSRARTALETDAAKAQVEFIHADICDIDISNASLVVLNFTLQFVPLEQRDGLLTKICNGMKPGGVLVLSEKVNLSSDALNDINITLHHNFKRTHGYSDLEISQKRGALENSLIPETIEQHTKRLATAGFTAFDVWYQCFNFMSLMAVK